MVEYDNESLPYQVQPSPLPYGYFNGREDSPICLQRTANMKPELVRTVDRYFDQQDVFRGQLPEDFFYLQNLLYGNEHILTGEDAQRYCQELASKQRHKIQKQASQQQTQSSPGSAGSSVPAT